MPIRLDEITVFRSISVEGRTLHMECDIERNVGGINSGFEAKLASHYCDPSMFVVDLA